MRRDFSKIDPVIRKQYNEYKNLLQKMNDDELIDRFNQDVGNPGWVRARASFHAALRDEFDDRNIDSSALGANGSMSFNKKIKIVDKKILIIE